MKVAVRLSVAAAAGVKVYDAFPVVASRATGLPRWVEPLANCTVPATEGVTVAVRVTACPSTAPEVGVAANVVVVFVALLVSG